MSKNEHLNRLITIAEVSLLDEEPGTERYTEVLKHLEGLKALQAKNKQRIDPNTVLSAIAPIVGGLLVAAYEQRHVFNRNSFSLFSKLFKR